MPIPSKEKRVPPASQEYSTNITPADILSEGKNLMQELMED